MPFNPEANQIINLEDASILTANFRKTFPSAILGSAYNRSQMQELLDQQNCEGFRIYNGLDDTGLQQLVIVGVDVNGDDLFRGIIIDSGQKTPPITPQPNPLNP